MKTKFIKLDDLIVPTQINILLVEDEADMSEIIELYLKDLGFNGNFYQAKSLNEAKMYLSKNKIDFIITDKTLPDGSGDALLKAIRKSDRYFKNIPLLVITGQHSLDEHILSSKLGASAYLTKPFSLEELSQKVADSFKSQVIPTEETIHELRKKIMELEEEIMDMKLEKGEFEIVSIPKLNTV